MACVGRGDQTTYAGSVLYAGQITTASNPTQQPITGSFLTALVVDDYTPACAYDQMQFTITLGTCTVVAVADGVAVARPNVFVDAAFVLAPAQSCDIVLPSGVAHVDFDDGVFGIDALGHLAGDMNGTVKSLNGIEATTGHIDLQFTGQ